MTSSQLFPFGNTQLEIKQAFSFSLFKMRTSSGGIVLPERASIRSILENEGKKRRIKHLKDWYKLKSLDEIGNSTLSEHFGKSLHQALQFAFPGFFLHYPFFLTLLKQNMNFTFGSFLKCQRSIGQYQNIKENIWNGWEKILG